MNLPTAIVIAAIVLGGAIAYGAGALGGRYQAVSVGSTAGIYKMDKYSGEVWLCGGGRCVLWPNADR